MMVDMMWCVGQKDTSEKNMKDRLRRYKTEFRELTMHQRQKIINEVSIEACVVNFLSTVQFRIEQVSGVKMNMMICQDTKPREDDAEV
eukprot:13902662-Ditylum_brightwellii.AAC.1